jgi:hypothetical protein
MFAAAFNLQSEKNSEIKHVMEKYISETYGVALGTPLHEQLLSVLNVSCRDAHF